jgi:geranylgeranyl pyrophosphate synthase
MIGKKTASLISASCEIGAILGSGTEEEIAALKSYGSDLGSAFQIHDDWLDVASNDAVLGKPVGSDISERKATFLSIHFLGRADKARRARFDAFRGKEDLTEGDLSELRDLFEGTGTFEAARKIIGAKTESALAALDRVRQTQAREDLKELALGLLERES